MRDNNNDPIQENKKFRFGLDDLIKDDSINGMDDYSDLHDCSNDLSDRGSIKEEYEHARFAENKRKNSYNYSYNQGKKQIVLIDKKRKFVIYLLVFFFFILPILQSVLGLVITIADGMISENMKDYEGSYIDSNIEISNDYSNENLVSDLETQRENIVVSSKMLPNKELLIETQNTSNYTMLDIRLQIIFYDGADKPIYISDMNISTLFANQKNIQTLYDVPENFERYDFLITQPFKTNRAIINYNDVDVNMIGEANSNLTFEVTNNTNETLNDVEVAILGYKGDELVAFETRSVWEIKPGKSKEGNIYLYNKDCDRIEYFVNDIYNYEK